MTENELYVIRIKKWRKYYCWFCALVVSIILWVVGVVGFMVLFTWISKMIGGGLGGG